MLHRLIGAALLLTAIALVCADLRAQDPTKLATPKDSSKMSAGEYTGVLKATPGSDRMFTLTITTQALVPTGRTTNAPRMNVPGMPNLNNAYNNVAKLQAQYIKQQGVVAKAKQKQYASAVSKLQQIGGQLKQAVTVFQLAAQQANIRNIAILNNGTKIPQFTIKTNKEDIEFQTTEGPKVRTMSLPEVFDDKGEVKKYTAAEKAELRGKDKSLPGYESSIEKLEAGQTLTVTLVPVKKKKVITEKDKDKEKEEKVIVEEEKKMQVKLLVITKEADGNVPKGKRKKNE